MTQIEELTKLLLEFRNRRNWAQFHTPKDLGLSIQLEAAELAEHFKWLRPEETASYAQSHHSAISHELADVLSGLLLLAHDLKIDLAQALRQKMVLNEQKYPAQKYYGRHGREVE